MSKGEFGLSPKTKILFFHSISCVNNNYQKIVIESNLNKKNIKIISILFFFYYYYFSKPLKLSSFLFDKNSAPKDPRCWQTAGLPLTAPSATHNGTLPSSSCRSHHCRRRIGRYWACVCGLCAFYLMKSLVWRSCSTIVKCLSLPRTLALHRFLDIYWLQFYGKWFFFKGGWCFSPFLRKFDIFGSVRMWWSWWLKEVASALISSPQFISFIF